MKNIPFPSLVKELVDFTENHTKKLKVQRVYRHCILAGKTELAKKIKSKYKEYFPHSDLVDSLAISLYYKSKF